MGVTKLIGSESIKVFPCVSRNLSKGSDELDAKLMSEKNITNLIKTVTDNSSFVLSDTNANPMRFVLDGYYFEIKNFDYTGTKYAYVAKQQDLIRGDNGNSFLGLTLWEASNDSDKPTTSPHLCLCSDGKVPASSRYKFNQSSFNISKIDCGELK
jgi:hypothetical protein